MRNRIALLGKSKGLLMALVAAVALTLVGTTYGYAQLGKEVTLSLDGEAMTIKTSGETVGDVLAEEEIKVGEHDIVAPGLDEKIDEGTRISVRFGRELKLMVDGKEQSYWVNSDNVEQALAELDKNFRGAALSASRGATIERGGMTLEVVTPKEITVTVGQEKAAKRTVAAATVAEALKKLEVLTDSNDIVSHDLDDKVSDGMKITVTKVNIETKDVTSESIKHGTVKKKDSSMYVGKSEVDRAGVNGARDVTYKYTYRNGKVYKTQVVKATVTKKPVDAVVRVGTKSKPKPAAKSTPNFAGGGTVWDQLAKCESGGNWSINTGNGYYGGLQFSASSWRGVGGSGLPHQASRAEQIKRGEMLKANGGWGHWPACSRKLGLR